MPPTERLEAANRGAALSVELGSLETVNERSRDPTRVDEDPYLLTWMCVRWIGGEQVLTRNESVVIVPSQ
jgi:hypothetical protein